MSKGWTYKSGDWNIICDSCGVKTKASKTRQRWDGFQVCPSCWEPRQSLDFIRARQDKISVPFTRPGDDAYLPIYAGAQDAQTQLSDVLNYAATYNRSVSDTHSSFSEAITYAQGKGISESFSSFSDGFTYTTTYSRGISDSTTVSDNLLFVQHTLVLNGAPLNEFTLG